MNWKFWQRKPKRKYPTVAQVMALTNREYPGMRLGYYRPGIYSIGNGRYTGRKGWDRFQDELLKRALNEPIGQ